jgi:hypothetical protein
MEGILLSPIEVGFHVYLEEGGEECGAVCGVAPDYGDHIIVHVENAGDFTVPASAIESAHDAKVILDPARLDPQVLEAMTHAHDRDEPGC